MPLGLHFLTQVLMAEFRYILKSVGDNLSTKLKFTYVSLLNTGILLSLLAIYNFSLLVCLPTVAFSVTVPSTLVLNPFQVSNTVFEQSVFKGLSDKGPHRYEFYICIGVHFIFYPDSLHPGNWSTLFCAIVSE